MLFWILVAILTAAVAAVLLLPLMRAAAPLPSRHSHDIEVYRDQLGELARDRDAGLIGSEEAELARAEIARRMLAASAADQAAAERTPKRLLSNRLSQAFIFLCLPAIGLCLYLTTGSPGVPAQPLAARLADPNGDVNILIAKAENHLALNPEDGAGWDLLAPIYMRHGRLEDAVAAYDRAIRLLGPTPARMGGYAEALVAQGGGLVTSEAQNALRKALALDPNDPRSAFYLALGLKQEGKNAEALSAFRKLAGSSPADAPWLPLVNQHIAELADSPAAVGPTGPAATGPAAPGNPTPGDIAAAKEMNDGDRQSMIRGMVDSLASRLKEDPANLEGWMRLIRSYVVLDQRDRAEEALHEGLIAFPATGVQGKQLLALAQELGLDAGGDTE
ncbi:c-type cytochrome biogenesis protein CcmI [Sinorhizobium medicae]|uniref:C-type cytochrome biogenesis protein CcmI n=2 Tax=Sinorhizobium medicae TaxID=110321 RepID=A0A6G1WWN2_9HYPH|nr:c-type cytochrome biogenesis protein CcmI [Sinorhizobium medicae]ABR59489.1 cytochrome C-type biogenesis transmembrane protein [Sinorhizobium medicae WSM419]MBO1963225.1 c-type cytochrome biogenesis protein CcmI [Sinorhizobium medicae]MDX0404117.1 c-type cytochrome biogenesis protein CcmI [Sinorhizobium medicae]MDX0409993.1 c-type cytochrome biogenesis protein CcmI [Sinorhizobium medicae]MDX0416471.1 c-type cytochrome biogenesis protein CcmI [Sinorhizobium medicae]